MIGHALHICRTNSTGKTEIGHIDHRSRESLITGHIGPLSSGVIETISNGEKGLFGKVFYYYCALAGVRLVSVGDLNNFSLVNIPTFCLFVQDRRNQITSFPIYYEL